MPKNEMTARHITSFTPKERRQLLYSAQSIYKQPLLEMRARLSTLPYGRILIITPKKIGTAPQRNLVKRRLKALFYEERLFEKRIDVIVYCTKNSASASFDQLKTSITAALEAAHQKLYGQSHH